MFGICGVLDNYINKEVYDFLVVVFASITPIFLKLELSCKSLFLATKHVGFYLPNQGSNLHSLHWKVVLTLGPPGKSLKFTLLRSLFVTRIYICMGLGGVRRAIGHRAGLKKCPHSDTGLTDGLTEIP